MKLNADSGSMTFDAGTPRDERAAALDGLCRTALRLFDVAVAGVVIEGEADSHLAFADGVDPAAWRFAGEAIRRIGRPGGPVVLDEAAIAAAINGLVVGAAPSVRFFAVIGFGEGGRLGLLGSAARAFGAEDARRLGDLAAIAGGLCSLVRRARDAERREAHFRLLAETSTDTIVRGDLDGVRLYISPAVRELLGYEPADLVGRRAIDITHPDDAAPLGAIMRDVRAGRLAVGRSEQRQRHKNGSWVWLESHLRLTYDATTGEPDGYVASVRGMDERKAIEARLEHLATHDALTGLPNRTLFRQQLLASLAETAAGRRFALLWMDLDSFKEINDSLGHQVGDSVLCGAAERFLSSIRQGDRVARLGGDEFALIAAIGPGSEDAEELARRLIEAMAAPILIAGHAIEVGLSIGIACAPEAGLDPDMLLAAADKALYAAKSAGRCTYRVFDPLAPLP